TLACQLALAWTAPDHQSLATAQQARDTDREMQQRDRLAAAQRRLATVRSRVSSDDTRFRSLQRELEELQATRLRRLDSLVMQRRAVHDLYTTSRQTAGDLITILRNTTTGPPADNLEQELAKLAASKRALDLNALAGLWEAMHLTLTDTATGSRRVVPVQIAPGELAQEEVTRIGTVLAVAGDRAVVYDRIAGVYRALPPGDREHRRLTLALSKNQSGISTAPFVPGPIKHVGRDAVAESVRGSGPIGVLIVVLGGIGIVVLTVRALLIYRMLRSEKLTGSDSAGGRLRAQRDSHQSERSESLAGWLNALVRREARKAQWGHTVLSVIIGVAPLLGLLGTVTGMIVTFHALRLYGGGDPILMADGIAQALSTTLLGLTVAIPLLIGQRWLLTWANRHVRRLDAQAVALLSESRGAT
ncbi:MAG: MotA/TolQ/ExbB proton channel family protein, partial [Gammaproteobacteria bacterium]|nr:MotA/TolQ/ExbB proton channel family protein [Gammaproteobacteria bacterium]